MRTQSCSASSSGEGVRYVIWPDFSSTHGTRLWASASTCMKRCVGEPFVFCGAYSENGAKAKACDCIDEGNE